MVKILLAIVLTKQLLKRTQNENKTESQNSTRFKQQTTITMHAYICKQYNIHSIL